MSKLTSQIWLAVRWGFCILAGFVNAVAIGFQGNGNPILSGLLIGLALGAVWAALLLFAAPALVRSFRFSLKIALLGTLLIVALLLLPIVSFHLWGHAISFYPRANKRPGANAGWTVLFAFE